MNEFLLLFRGGDGRAVQQSPDEMQAHMQKWGAWMHGLGEQGKLLGGQPLKNEGKVLEKGGEVITDGPFAEGKEIVGGYLLIKAENFNEAVEISKACPIFEFDGTVEVREIQPMDL
ncbi:YciI family protein [Flexithrix dorotheae]|uniref:YciI family protein n=1 Tax=Flexithrix dorotheae TaxID=70993 RepID=UPI00037C58D1|nr:YciI family protein [Flexithrix dorotheae]